MAFFKMNLRQGSMTMYMTQRPRANFAVRGCEWLSSATADTAPSKLRSQVKPTNIEMPAMIDVRNFSMPPDSSSSAILSRRTMTRKARTERPTAKRTRASMWCTERPRTPPSPLSPPGPVDIQAQRKAKKRHQAQLMVHACIATSATSSTRRLAPSSSSLPSFAASFSRLASTFPVMVDKAMKPAPTAKSLRAKSQLHVNLTGSSRPSMLGSWPVRPKRTTCTNKKEMAKAKISTSASEQNSSTILARMPSRTTAAFVFKSSSFRFAASRLTLARIAWLTWNTRLKKAQMRMIGTSASHGFRLKGAACWMLPPAATAAKPAQCASSVAQQRLTRFRRSSSTNIFFTGTSRPVSGSM
mmetsp:Transcript_97040/g.279280  ORF Transcript_97040/g.279280 Transcript_97040/m.279280 type:complete len:356 (-) Transcript_97040:201-1268(-)